MAQGDRVVVGDGYYWKESDDQKTMAYEVIVNEKGEHIKTPDGASVVGPAGGIVCGSTGTISGPAISVHRSYLHENSNRSTAMGNDFAELVPVMLDKYQRIGYFPIDYVRIFSGGVA